jgi:hypothetical protein
MSKFSDFWKSAAFYGNPKERLGQITAMMGSIDKEMQSKVDPTRWRKLLDQREALEKEQQALSKTS